MSGQGRDMEFSINEVVPRYVKRPHTEFLCVGFFVAFKAKALAYIERISHAKNFSSRHFITDFGLYAD